MIRAFIEGLPSLVALAAFLSMLFIWLIVLFGGV